MMSDENPRPEDLEGKTKSLKSIQDAKTEAISFPGDVTTPKAMPTGDAAEPAVSPTASPDAAADGKEEEEAEPFLVEDAKTEASEELKGSVVDVLKTVFDPEIPVNIYELGMIYRVEVDEDRRVLVTMTLTSPSCPVAGTLPGEVEQKVKDTETVDDAKVDLVWDPPWTPDMMSEAAKLELNMM